MSLKYICRHCQTEIGMIDRNGVAEYQLGFHYLTPEERQDMIAQNPDGSMTVKVICDYCKEALEANPELSLIGSPLQ